MSLLDTIIANRQQLDAELAAAALPAAAAECRGAPPSPAAAPVISIPSPTPLPPSLPPAADCPACQCPQFWLDPYKKLHCMSCQPPARPQLVRRMLIATSAGWEDLDYVLAVNDAIRHGAAFGAHNKLLTERKRQRHQKNVEIEFQIIFSHPPK